MASSAYESTSETTNTNRVCRVILGPCTDGLRDILHHYVPPSTFPHVIKVNKKNLPRLTADQRDLILPQHGSYTGNYSDMDISLLYILLRNITSGIPPHANGWGKDPDPSDRSLSANIERVRMFRNKCYGHSISASMSNSDFNSTWSDIRSVMIDVDTFLNNRNKYQMAVDRLRSESMDPELDEHYTNELRKQVEEDRTTRKMVDNLDRKVESVEEQMKETNQKVEALDGKLEEKTKTLHGKVERVEEQMKETDKKVEALDGKLEEKTKTLHGKLEEKTKTLHGKFEEETKTLHGKVGRVEERTEETDKKVEALDGKLEEKTKTLHDKVEKFTVSVIPPNVRDQHNIDIKKWREEDKLYYETHSFPSVMETVRNQPCMTFVGGPGSGKSAMAHHIALKLQEEGYEVVPVDEIREIKQYCDTKNPQVFVIDDVVGVFGLQKTKLDVLTDYEQKIVIPCMDKSKTLMTCREAVFNETLHYKPFLTKEETVIRLNSSDHELDDNDKKQILQKYGLNEDLMSPALLKLTSHMFPLLCKLFSKETKFQDLGYKFFLNPVQCIIDELDEMQRHNKLNYATLILCMLNENSLAKDILKDRKNDHFMNMKIDTLENCELESQTDTFKFVKALSAMEGTYTKQSGAQYTFIHDSMFEICAYHYGQQFPDQMLLYMSSSYIANSVKPQTSEPGIAPKVKEKQSDSQSSKGDKSSNDSDGKKESDDKSNEREESFDLCIRLREDQYPLLAERLYRDIQNMELYDVFRNPVLKHPQVCQAFIGVLETKSYTELKSLFLSRHGEVDKIVSKQECLEKERWEEWRRQREELRRQREELRRLREELRRQRVEWRRETALMDQRWKGDGKGGTINTHNVRVISWVIGYGHHQIIEYIIQQTEQHNQTSELYEITGNSQHQSKSGISTCNEQESVNNRLVEQYRLLLLSCYSGDVQTVRVLIPVCKKAINGLGQISRGIYWCDDTPLTAASEGGHVDIVRELLKVGADVNIQDNSIQGNTPLITACRGGHVDIVRELLKVGADVNIQDDGGNTPLIAACAEGHVSVVVELVKARADVNLQDRRGNTPLIAACQGLKVFGYAPLIAACEGGHVSVVEELVKAGADVNLQGEYGNTPLISACYRGHVSVVEELVKARADVNLQAGQGFSPLIAAVRQGSLSTVKCLVEHGADWVTRVVDFNVSAVYRALILNKPDIVKYLIQQQNKIIPGQFTGNVHLFNCLVEIRHAGVKTDSRDDVVTDRSVWCMDRWGGLWRTIEQGDCDVLRHLLCVGLDVNQSIQLYKCRSSLFEDIDDTSDVRPLLYTLIDEAWYSVKHRTEKVNILLGAGADVNVRVRYRENDPMSYWYREYVSVLDREGVSALERTRRRVYEYSEYKREMCDIKKHGRRHSV